MQEDHAFAFVFGGKKKPAHKYFAYVLYCLPLFKAFALPQVKLVTNRVDRLVPRGVRTVEGEEFDADVVIFATGFNVLDSTRAFKVTGRCVCTIPVDRWI